MGLFGLKNPLKRRQPGASGHSPQNLYHPKTITALDMLRTTPDASDDDLATALGLSVETARPFLQQARGILLKEQLQQGKAPEQAEGRRSALLTHQGQGELNLINYKPEELVQQVDQELARIQFGWTRTIRFMEDYSEVWSLVGPLVLLLGTIGEVFLVLWLRQRVQDILAGLSIVAVALVLEGTFLAVSYKAATMRNRAEKRDGGPTERDKKKLKRQFHFWVALAFGVCATQVIFIAAQTKPDGIGLWGVWIFALLRAVFTLVADGYTAFAHEEKPTDDEQALEEREKRAKASEAFLAQKRKEIDIINDGILAIRAAHTEAIIKDEKLQTHLKVERLQNKAQIETLKNQQEQATMFTTLANNMMRALFDPTLPDDQREKLLGTMQGFMGVMKQLPPSGQITRIEEEDV